MRQLALLFLFVLSFTACRKSNQTVVPGNQVPYYDGIPTVLVENYVNRLFIDLIGREPVDSEMVSCVEFLRSKSLAMDARDSLVRMLMYNPAPAAGDSSYQYFYFQRFYELMKIRLIEGAADSYIAGEIGILQSGYLVDSLNGDSVGMAQKRFEMNKYQRILDSQLQLRYGEITIDSVCQRMVNNAIYDFINMNSFNFINATFDNLFYRYPTSSEFDRAYMMVDGSNPATLFGRSGSNKTEYIDILIGQRELFQGVIIWCYKTLLARDPSTSEVYSLLQPFVNTRNVQDVQRKILITDEYANFR